MHTVTMNVGDMHSTRVQIFIAAPAARTHELDSCPCNDDSVDCFVCTVVRIHLPFRESLLFRASKTAGYVLAYFCVHSRAVVSCLSLSRMYICAISGTKGSFGLGSVSRDEILRRTLLIVSAGDH